MSERQCCPAHKHPETPPVAMPPRAPKENDRHWRQRRDPAPLASDIVRQAPRPQNNCVRDRCTRAVVPLAKM